MDASQRRAEAGRVYARRDALGWTQRDLAEYASVSLGTVGNIEAGKKTPQKAKLEAVLAALDFGERSQAYSGAIRNALDQDNQESLPAVSATQLEFLVSIAELRVRQTPEHLRGCIEILVDTIDRSRVDEATERIAVLGRLSMSDEAADDEYDPLADDAPEGGVDGAPDLVARKPGVEK